MLKDKIQKDIITSLKQGKKLELKVLRFILSGIKYAEIDKKEELSDEEIVSLLQKEVKKRKEAIEMFKKGKRDDLVNDEEKQLEIIAKYLPEQLSMEELSNIIDETVSFTPDKSNIGKIIGLVMSKVKGRANGQTVAGLIKQRLQNK